jgi:glutamyl-tRNA synthetase
MAATGKLTQRGVTRLAPSPTGALHLGNARTFLVNWALARRHGWRTLLRIEDLDGPRVKPESIRQTRDILAWLGLTWDAEAPLQSTDLGPCRDALRSLIDRDLAYPCNCTRREIEHAQSAPHADAHDLRYPGTCRRRPVPAADAATAMRVLIPDEPISFTDAIHGTLEINVQQQVGDFVVATRQGLPSYQLAVVVDDARQGVDEVVRGDDLLASTARQRWLQRMLGLPTPRYTHLPLVVGEDGRRLAKRHGDTRLITCRQRGVPAERVIGLLAAWSGVCATPEPMTAHEFAQRFDLAALPRQPVVMTKEHESWLTST